MARLSSSLPSVRILVLGDSGVGKTSLLLSLTSPTAPLASSLASTSLSSVRSTIGCTPHTLLLPSVAFIELFDVGGHRKYALSRSTFYRDVDGLLLVFDCSNTKSYTHLSRWIAELVQHNASNSSSGSHTLTSSQHYHDRDDQPQQASTDLSSLPVLAVGTKSDLMDGKAALFDSMRDYGLDMVMLSAKAGGTSAGGGDSSTLHALLPFFHRVLDRKAELAAIGFRSHNGRSHNKLSTTTAVYQRKSGGGSRAGGGYGSSSNGTGGDYGDERAWDKDGVDVEERREAEEEGDGGLTIDMNQLDMLSAYNASHARATHTSTATARHPSPSSSLFASSSSPLSGSRHLSSPSVARQSSSPLSRLLPSSLFGLGGKKDEKQARARV